ncbi:Pyruvate kinase isozymes R/L [Echinococcus granulosus]|uniref:Pyruvate kinase n=1 Tax=Echinococcus granulosus TaxID=6210 RepID=W6UUW1_ECHGR|nr:Pyruvate kinase isozymes R/L [Echinococcus granulosus]EUB62142.1 Pyruvate kinase isozymes R/L [Echinococcus granulosus]
MNFSATTLQTHSETGIGERHNAFNDLFTAPRQISHLQYTCNLDIDQVADNVRQTSIVCTLGKSWKTKEGILKMMDAGMNIMLINLSMTPRDICKEVIQYAREIEKESGYARLLGIAMDMTAAPVRTGIFEGGHSYEANLKEGARVTLTLDDHYKFQCTPEMIFINTKYFPQLINCLRKGDKVYLDDGQVSLIVKDVGLDGVNCMVEEGGIIGSYKRVTLPRDRLYQESVQLNYINDLKFAAECEVDYVFTSFAEDSIMIHLARNHLPGSTKVFAKLETRVTIKNLHDLIAASDGLVIRRSDLAMQYTPEKIFKLQKYIVAHCNIAEKPVFIIEQLLESMVSKPRPTRAESSDIANAVLDGADGLVLTMETSWGMYALDSVHVVDNICREAERAVFHFETREELKQCRLQMEQGSFDIRSVTGASAAEAAASCNATAIFVITTTGASATSIAMLRPPCSVIAITLDVSVARHCLAYRGLHSYVYTGKSEDDWALDIDNRINAAIEHSRITGLVKGGDRIIVVTGSVATSGSTNTMHIFTLEEEHSKLRIVGSSHEVAATGAQEGLLNLADRTTEQQQNEQKDEEELDALEEIRLIQGARSRRPRFSVMLSSNKSSFGGINDIRVPL